MDVYGRIDEDIVLGYFIKKASAFSG